jgi:hypothetical protein
MATPNIDASDVAAILGLAFGVVGTTLGVLNYLRDRANVVISLKWDMSVTPGTEYDPRKKWGFIHIANTGRRSIFLSHVALRLPKGSDHSHLVIMDGITGVKLAEGDPAKVYVVTQEGLEPYSPKWRDVRAQITDAAGKDWVSKRVPKNKKPSWAAGANAA